MEKAYIKEAVDLEADRLGLREDILDDQAAVWGAESAAVLAEDREVVEEIGRPDQEADPAVDL